MNPSLPELPPHLAKVDKNSRTYWALACVAALLSTFQTRQGLRNLLATGKRHVLHTLRTGYDGHDLKDEDFDLMYAELCRHAKIQLAEEQAELKAHHQQVTLQ